MFLPYRAKEIDLHGTFHIFIGLIKMPQEVL